MIIPTINAFGLGINDADVSPFLGSDYYLPAGWKSYVTGHPGSLPQQIALPATFLVIGTGGILAVAKCIDATVRPHRWTHRPDEDGQLVDIGAGFVLDIDPNSWRDHSADPLPIVNHRVSRSYEYGSFDGLAFTQITAADRRAA